MQTILVLTDFSEKAKNAAIYALKIAENAHADIILYHSSEEFYSVNAPESGSFVSEDYEIAKKESLKELNKLKDYMATNHEKGAFEPKISFFHELGLDLATSINNLVK